MKTLTINQINKKTYSIKTQTAAVFLAIIAAVTIPQIFHVMGAVSGVKTAFGEIFLPMHLPVIFVGLLVGSYTGAIAGMLSPLVSFALTGMPNIVMLPFMMIELCAYGFIAGILRNSTLPAVVKVLAVQIAGRIVRAVAIVLAVYVFSASGINVATIWMSVIRGIFGIMLQLTVIPLLLYYVEGVSKNEQ